MNCISTMGNELHLQEFSVMGFSIRTSKSPEGIEKITQVLDYFIATKAHTSIPNKVDENLLIAVYYDYDQEGNYTLLVGCPVTSFTFTKKIARKLPYALEGRTFNAGNYKQFKLVDNVPTMIKEIWQKIDADASLQRAWTADFELYRLSDYEKPIVEIYISMKK